MRGLERPTGAAEWRMCANPWTPEPVARSLALVVESREAWLERMAQRRLARGLPPTLDDPTTLATLAAVILAHGAQRPHEAA